MVFGEERIFLLSGQSQRPRELYLRFLYKESKTLKMRGDFPPLWNVQDQKIDGPKLRGDDCLYSVVGVDYGNHSIWLTQAEKEKKHLSRSTEETE